MNNRIPKAFIIAFVLAGIISLLVIVYTLLANRVSPPIFNKMQYSHSAREISGCFGQCFRKTVYYYTAVGSEKEIAEDVIAVMGSKGFSLSDQNPVSCLGAPGDYYGFDNKSTGRFTWVEFIPKSSPPDVDSTAIGCERSNAEYTVTLDPS